MSARMSAMISVASSHSGPAHSISYWRRKSSPRGQRNSIFESAAFDPEHNAAEKFDTAAWART